MKILSRFNRSQIEELQVDESMFAVQNGFIGIRGNFSEGYGKNDIKQTLINGFYNNYKYTYEENSPAFPQKGSRIVNVIDGQTIDFYINHKKINMTECKLLSLERSINMETGITCRTCIYENSDGFQFKLEEERMASFVQKELAVIKIKFTSIDFEGDLSVISKLVEPELPKKKTLDPRINQSLNPEIFITDKLIEDDGINIIAKTTDSNLSLCAGMNHAKVLNYRITDKGIEAYDDLTLKPGSVYEITKFLVYTPSTVFENIQKENQKIMQSALKNGYRYYLDKQKRYLDTFWKNSYIHITGDDRLNLMLQYNIYQLNASAVDDERFNICAKGLTGEGYEGHYFWDSEIYMLPFFTITNPKMAKNLLIYRYKHFSEAKEEALKQGSPVGVKIPWRTITGEELSPYYPAGSAQYHINSDLAYSVIKYYEFTNDYEFFEKYGFEMLLETARFLYNAGNYSEGSFHINGVTGPDEYTAVVNDNYYTNSMAKYHFEKLVDFYKNEFLDNSEIIKRLNITDQEMNDFQDAAEKMYFIYNSELDIYAQDHSFLRKKTLDLKKIPKSDFPLLLHYHPLFIYKHQVLKQADVLLSMFLLDYDNETCLESNFKYYLEKTSHDSSLSKCIHSIVAFRLKKLDLAYEYFYDVLKIDFDNTHKNTDQGLHIANSGGSYLAAMYGLLGLRINKYGLVIRPNLPEKIKGFKVKFNYHDTVINIELNDKINIFVSKPINLGIYNDVVYIERTYLCDYK